MNTHATDGVRAAVGAMDREVALLGEPSTAGEGSELAALRTSWKALACGTCWKVLVPPPSAAVGHWGPAR
jgi:hypothetical protein